MTFDIKNIVSKHQLYYLHSDNSRRVATVVQKYSLITLVLFVVVLYCTHNLVVQVLNVLNDIGNHLVQLLIVVVVLIVLVVLYLFNHKEEHVLVVIVQLLILF